MNCMMKGFTHLPTEFRYRMRLLVLNKALLCEAHMALQ